MLAPCYAGCQQQRPREWCSRRRYLSIRRQHPASTTDPWEWDVAGGDPDGNDMVLIDFWASWCPPCVYEMPAMKRLKQDLNDQPFEILAPNVGEKKYRVLRFTRLVKFDLLVLLDTDKEAFRTWGSKILPTSYLIDASGRLRYRIRGNPDWDDENTRALITELVEEVSQTFASTE